MKKLVALLFVLSLCIAPLAVSAASCTQGGVTVQGDTCAIVAGECICADFGPPKK